MKAYFLFHDKWTEYVKADWAASRFPFDGFVVIEKTRAGLVRFLRRRMRRLGIRKVADEILLRLYYVLFQSRGAVLWCFVFALSRGRGGRLYPPEIRGGGRAQSPPGFAAAAGASRPRY